MKDILPHRSSKHHRAELKAGSALAGWSQPAAACRWTGTPAWRQHARLSSCPSPQRLCPSLSPGQALRGSPLQAQKARPHPRLTQILLLYHSRQQVRARPFLVPLSICPALVCLWCSVLLTLNRHPCRWDPLVIKIAHPARPVLEACSMFKQGYLRAAWTDAVLHCRCCSQRRGLCSRPQLSNGSSC